MDVAILGLLQNNARLSVKEIAAEVALAPSSTHERIKRMRDSGVLRGTHAEVDPKALGVGLEALFMIELSKHQRGTVDQFMDDIAGVPEVRVAFLVPAVTTSWCTAGYAAFEGPRPRPVHEPARGHPHRDLDHLRDPPSLPTPDLSNGRLNS
jgi:Winged helix-turn-helix DNA-binding